MAESYRLFLVEDDDNVALLITKALERAGHVVTRCRTGADAIIVLGHNNYDLVLLDHRLPDMAGLDLLQTLARENITTPALMVTANGDEQLAARVLRAGVLDYVIKDPALNFLHELPRHVSESIIRHRLQQTNRLLSEALESARDGVVITNLQGQVIHVNQALERMTGWSRGELRTQTPQALHRGTPSESHTDQVWKTVLGRQTWQGELVLKRRDGSLLDVSLAVSPILDARGQMTHCVGIYRDIEDRKYLEKQLLQAHKIQSLGTLAGGVAHEFNNLLAGILGYTELALRESGIPALLHQYLSNVKELSERAARLTSDMLAYARRPDLRRLPTSMEELVRSTAEFVTRTLKVAVEVHVPDRAGGPPLVVAAAADELRQALINLALNARDALEKPAPIVFRLRHAVLAEPQHALTASIPAGEYVVLEVVDAGTGMAPDVLTQALDPFFTTKEVGRGTGLGLPLVQRIVEAHHGYLSIDTALGRGTTVSLFLPHWQESALPNPDAASPRGEILEPESHSGYRILVVDDEEPVRDVVRRFLELAGHSVHSVGSGAEAVAWVEQNQPVDLVILDLMMPKEDGVTTYRKLHQLRPELPVLFCTGQLDDNSAWDTPQNGLVSILRKPFRMTELWYAVAQSLRSVPTEA